MAVAAIVLTRDCVAELVEDLDEADDRQKPKRLIRCKGSAEEGKLAIESWPLKQHEH